MIFLSGFHEKCIIYMMKNIFRNQSFTHFHTARQNIHILAVILVSFIFYNCNNKILINVNPASGATFRISGHVHGLALGETMVLQNNSVDNTTVNASGSGNDLFSFPTPVASSTTYNVTVLTKPNAKNCDTITSGFGTIQSSDIVDISIICIGGLYSVGGNITGLATGNSVQFQFNYVDPIVGTNTIWGTFLGNTGFPVPFASTVILSPNATYVTTVASTSAGVVCSPITNGTGVITTFNKRDMALSCAATCGNGVVNAYEGCDDGNLVNGDGCNSMCQIEPCGNGVLNVGETCDDGNLVNGDGCSSLCQLECSNAIIDPGESCDDGNLIAGDGCSATCQIEPPITCGNGVINPGETCDDTNHINGDGCNAYCQSEGISAFPLPTSFDNNTMQGWSATGLWHISAVRSFTGLYSMHYANALTGTYDTPGASNSGALVSPVTPVLTGTASVSFNYFLNGECAQTIICSFDVLSVQISTNGGLTWINIENLPEEQLGIAPGGLIAHVTPLGAYAGSTARIRFYFNTKDNWSNAFEGAYIDNILITP